MKYLVGLTVEVQLEETLDTVGRKTLAEMIAKKLKAPLGPDEVSSTGMQISYIYDNDDECIFEC